MAFTGLNFKVPKNTIIDDRTTYLFWERNGSKIQLIVEKLQEVVKSRKSFPYYRFAKTAISVKKGQKWTCLSSNLKVEKKAKNDPRTTLEFKE